MVTKINVSMPDEVVKEIDKVAGEIGATRSGFLVRAARSYLQEIEDRRKREKRSEAIKTIRAIASKAGDWDAVGELLRSRDRH